MQQRMNAFDRRRRGGGGGCGDCVWEELCPTHIILPLLFAS